jgi:hypothetical protein
MTTIETIPGTRELGERLAACEINFAASIAEKIGGTKEDGFKVLRVYIKQKLVKRDLTNRTFNVKHGGFWDAKVIRRAIAYANENGI